jgi:hypothetical protein
MSLASRPTRKRGEEMHTQPRAESFLLSQR